MKQKIIQALPSRLFIALKKWGWYGNFKSWQEASQKSVGYDADNILEKVKNSLLKVKNGHAVYERDSVLFDKIEYSWEVLAGLMWIAAQNKGNLNLIDFGGSLGSTYYQNKYFLDSLNSVSWNIVEQSNFVTTGKEYFEDGSLHFFSTIEECLCAKEINVFLFSNVLQYLDDPYELMFKVLNKNVDYIIIDKTNFTLNDIERITIQKVSNKIYGVSLPCRFFAENQFLSFFTDNGYELLSDFITSEKTNIPSKSKGFIFKKVIA